MPLPSRLQVRHEGLSIVILGASGDLASKKLFPSLFNLHSAGFLPTRTKIFAALRDRKKRRSELEFKTELTEHINRVWKPPDGSNATKPTKGLMEEFLEDVEVCHLDEDFVSEEEKKKKKKKKSKNRSREDEEENEEEEETDSESEDENDNNEYSKTPKELKDGLNAPYWNTSNAHLAYCLLAISNFGNLQASQSTPQYSF